MPTLRARLSASSKTKQRADRVTLEHKHSYFKAAASAQEVQGDDVQTTHVEEVDVNVKPCPGCKGLEARMRRSLASKWPWQSM